MIVTPAAVTRSVSSSGPLGTSKNVPPVVQAVALKAASESTMASSARRCRLPKSRGASSSVSHGNTDAAVLVAMATWTGGVRGAVQAGRRGDRATEPRGGWLATCLDRACEVRERRDDKGRGLDRAGRRAQLDGCDRESHRQCDGERLRHGARGGEEPRGHIARGHRMRAQRRRRERGRGLAHTIQRDACDDRAVAREDHAARWNRKSRAHDGNESGRSTAEVLAFAKA